MISDKRESILGPVVVGMLAALVVCVVLRLTAYVPLTPLQSHFAKSVVPTPLPVANLDESCNAWKAPGDLAIYPSQDINVSQPEMLPQDYVNNAGVTLGNISILGVSGNFFQVIVNFNSTNSNAPKPLMGYVNRSQLFPWGRLNPVCAQLGITWKNMDWVIDS